MKSRLDTLKRQAQFSLEDAEASRAALMCVRVGTTAIIRLSYSAVLLLFIHAKYACLRPIDPRVTQLRATVSECFLDQLPPLRKPVGEEGLASLLDVHHLT